MNLSINSIESVYIFYFILILFCFSIFNHDHLLIFLILILYYLYFLSIKILRSEEIKWAPNRILASLSIIV